LSEKVIDIFWLNSSYTAVQIGSGIGVTQLVEVNLMACIWQQDDVFDTFYGGSYQMTTTSGGKDCCPNGTFS
jgi:hypothetical protein